MANQMIFLDTYVLQQDMRVRLPKACITNMDLEKGKSSFDIFFDSENNCLILKKHSKEKDEEIKR